MISRVIKELGGISKNFQDQIKMKIQLTVPLGHSKVSAKREVYAYVCLNFKK
jgi:hypothetical protein